MRPRPLSLRQGRAYGAFVIGRAGMDLYPEPDGTTIAHAERFVADVGGSAGNIAVALARLGIRAALLSPLSDDAVGRFVRDRLGREGVDTRRCRGVAGDARTSLALAETRSTDCEVVIYRNNAADLAFDSTDVDGAQIGDASALVVTGSALATEPSRSAVHRALDVARAAGTFAVLDVDHRPYSWRDDAEAGHAYREAAGQCDAVVGNEDEFAVMAGGDRGRALDVATGLVQACCAFVVVKRGEHGALTLTADGSFATGVFPVVARKPFGAGDAFMGALLSALLAGGALPEAVARGSAAAAIVVSRRGCASAMPTTGELEDFLARQRLSAGA